MEGMRGAGRFKEEVGNKEGANGIPVSYELQRGITLQKGMDLLLYCVILKRNAISRFCVRSVSRGPVARSPTELHFIIFVCRGTEGFLGLLKG